MILSFLYWMENKIFYIFIYYFILSRLKRRLRRRLWWGLLTTTSCWSTDWTRGSPRSWMKFTRYHTGSCPHAREPGMQCWGSLTFWYLWLMDPNYLFCDFKDAKISGYADPYLWLLDPDPGGQKHWIWIRIPNTAEMKMISSAVDRQYFDADPEGSYCKTRISE